MAANVGAGGWADFLGKRPTDPLTQADADRILSYVMGRILADPVIAAAMIFPLSNGWAIAQVKATEEAIRKGLAARIGRPLSEVPADLGKLQEVRDGVPGLAGPTSGWGAAGDWVGQIINGVGDIAAHGLLLAGIIAVLLLGLWYLFRQDRA